MAATALFISSSDALRDEVAAHASGWHDVVFEFATHLNESMLVRHPSLAILYFHADVVTSVDWMQLLKLTGELESQPAVVAVMDAFDLAGAVSLLQLGVTDCLPTPIDFSRMAMQVGYESWRAYHGPRPSRQERASELSLANFGPVSLAATLPVPFELESSRRSAELAAISQALAAHNNNRSKAAAALGVSRVTLYKKLHKYGMMGLAQDAG